jgi:hypothetical protein
MTKRPTPFKADLSSDRSLRRPCPDNLVTLSWSWTDAEHNIITSPIGPVRGNSIIVTAPAASTTFTLEAANQYGRTKKTLTL